MTSDRERARLVSVRYGLLLVLVGLTASAALYSGAARAAGDGMEPLSWFLSTCGLLSAALTLVVLKDTWPLWRTRRQKKEDLVREVLRS